MELTIIKIPKDPPWELFKKKKMNLTDSVRQMKQKSACLTHTKKMCLPGSSFITLIAASSPVLTFRA